MPELPEVETVRAGLAPMLAGARIGLVRLGPLGLRFPFPRGLAGALEGAVVETVARRAKYLLFPLSSGMTVLSHLGMTGAYRFAGRGGLDGPTRLHAPDPAPVHDHMAWDIDHPKHGALELVYSDPRRFGFVDLFATGTSSRFLEGLGPEPLSNGFDAKTLALRFKGRKGPVKAGLLDQRVVAGIGNIYACEALHRAGIAPTLPAGALVGADGAPAPALEALVVAVRDVLAEAIAAGGSTFRDFRAADGGKGHFQEGLRVYGREGAPCRAPGCGGRIARIVQAGRSSFFCPACQGPNPVDASGP